MDFLKKKHDFVDLIIKHIGTSAIMDLLLRLLTCIEPPQPRQEVLNVSKKFSRFIVFGMGNLSVGLVVYILTCTNLNSCLDSLRSNLDLWQVDLKSQSIHGNFIAHVNRNCRSD